MERPRLNQFFSDKRIPTLRQPYVLVFQYTEGGQSSHLDNFQGHAFCMQTLSALITDKTQMFLEDDFLESLFHPWYIPLVSYFLVHYLIWLLLSFFIHYQTIMVVVWHNRVDKKLINSSVQCDSNFILVLFVLFLFFFLSFYFPFVMSVFGYARRLKQRKQFKNH